MEVVVEDQQLSLAIGKKGQNVRLAAKLTGWRIDIKSEEEKRREVEAQFGDFAPESEEGDTVQGDEGESTEAGAALDAEIETPDASGIAGTAEPVEAEDAPEPVEAAETTDDRVASGEEPR
jgi:transcription termination/antitermination protein NusA